MAKDEKVSGMTEIVRHICHETRRKHNTEEQIRVVLAGLRGESSIAELCRLRGINPNLYCQWSEGLNGKGT